MGSLVSRRRKRSEVRNVSTQATECIPGRVLHGVTDSLEDQKLQGVVTEVTIGDGLPTSPVLRYARARHASLNKKRTGFSRVLGGVRTKVDRKQQQQLQPTSRADFSAQYDFLALPGQVSPTYRRRSEDAAASAGRKASTAPRRSRNDTPDAPAAARSLATTEDGRTESAKKVGNKDADHPKPPKDAARCRVGERSAIWDKEMSVAIERRKGARAASLDDLRIPLRPKAQDRTGQKASGAGSGARGGDRKARLGVSTDAGKARGADRKASLGASTDAGKARGGDRKASLRVSTDAGKAIGGNKRASLEMSTASRKARGDDRKASLEVSTDAVRARGGDRSASLEVSTGAGKAGQKSTGVEVDERNTERDATRAAAAVWESEEQNADENCNILKEGTLLQDLRNAEIYGACSDSDDVSAVVPETREKTNAEPSVNGNNCLLHEEINDVKQNIPIDADDKGFTEALHEKKQAAARSLIVPAENEVDEASFGQVDKSTFQPKMSGELPKIEVQPQKQPDAEARNETEVQVEAEEDEDIAEDTLDWNADDRTRSPSDSRPNSVSSYANDEDCTIDAIETTVNQPQTSLTTLQDSSTHSFPDSLSISAAQVTSVSDVGGFHLSTRREETDATDQYQGLVKKLLPAAWLEKTQSVSTAADNEFIKVPRAPLVVPEETDIYFSAFSTDYPGSSSRCSRQQRDVCIQKSCHDHADVCLFAEFMGPRDPARFKGASTADSAQQTLLTQPNEIDTHTSVREPTSDKIGETGFNSPDCKTEDMANKMQKVDTKLTSGGTPQKSLLAMQETQAMTLLILTGSLPGETDCEGAIRGAGDAQNLDSTSGVEEGQEISETEGIAVMLRTQSKSSCKLEQLQVADRYESLSRLIDSGLSCPAGEEAHHTIHAMAAEDLHCQNSSAEVSTAGAEEDLNIQDRIGSPSPQLTQFHNCLSVTSVSLQEVQELSIENGKMEQASNSTGEEDQEAGTLPLTQLSAAAPEEIQPESILSSSECNSFSTELTTGSVADILEKSSSFPCLEPSLGVVSSTSEEDWDIIPLRRVPAHTNLNSAEACASLLPAGDEIMEIQSMDAEDMPEYQNYSKDVKDEVLEAIPKSMQLEPLHAAQPYISYAEGDSNPAPDSPMYPTLEDKINYKAEVPPEALHKEGTGDLLPPKSTATDPDVLRMEDAAQNDNANNSQAMKSSGKKKKKKKGGKGKQK